MGVVGGTVSPKVRSSQTLCVGSLLGLVLEYCSFSLGKPAIAGVAPRVAPITIWVMR